MARLTPAQVMEPRDFRGVAHCPLEEWIAWKNGWKNHGILMVLICFLSKLGLEEMVIKHAETMIRYKVFMNFKVLTFEKKWFGPTYMRISAKAVKSC